MFRERKKTQYQEEIFVINAKLTKSLGPSTVQSKNGNVVIYFKAKKCFEKAINDVFIERLNIR